MLDPVCVCMSSLYLFLLHSIQLKCEIVWINACIFIEIQFSSKFWCLFSLYQFGWLPFVCFLRTCIATLRIAVMPFYFQLTITKKKKKAKLINERRRTKQQTLFGCLPNRRCIRFVTFIELCIKHPLTDCIATITCVCVCVDLCFRCHRSIQSDNIEDLNLISKCLKISSFVHKKFGQWRTWVYALDLVIKFGPFFIQNHKCCRYFHSNKMYPKRSASVFILLSSWHSFIHSFITLVFLLFLLSALSTFIHFYTISTFLFIVRWNFYI